MDKKPMRWRVSLKAKYIPDGEYIVDGNRQYGDGAQALVIWDRGEVMTKATVCLAEYSETPLSGFVWIKTWSENEGVLEALVAAKVVEIVETTPPFPCGDHGATAWLCKVIPPTDDNYAPPIAG